MAYTPVTWVEGITKLGPTNMNHIEQGISDAHALIPGGAGFATTLSAAVSASATSTTLASTTGILIGHYIGLSIGTSTCEVRRITNISGTAVSWTTALKFSHSSGDKVGVTSSAVPIVWWGAKPGDSTFDSFRNLSNMFLDAFLTGSPHTFIGAGYGTSQLFYSSKPLWWPDGTKLVEASFGVYTAGFAIDATSGLWLYDSWPQQHFCYSVGQGGTVLAVATSANTVQLSATPGVVQGEPVAFYVREGLGTLPTGIEEGRTYYLKTTDSTSTPTLTLSIDKWGTSTVTISTTGSGEICWLSPGLTRLYTDHVFLSGGGRSGNVRGLNGYYGVLQQQSMLKDFRVDNFAGFGVTLSGQQAIWMNPEINSNARGGLRLSGAEIMYFYGLNAEQNDINVELLDMSVQSASAAPSSGNNRGILFSGGHHEGPGATSKLYQTLKASGSITGGTFTLNGQTLSYTATVAEVQTACDTLFGAGNSVASSTGSLPASNIQIAFQGVYQYGWGPTLTIVNSVSGGGSMAVNTINPGARQISLKGGLDILFSSITDSFSIKADGNYPSFLTVESAASGANYATFGGYALQNITAFSVPLGYFVEDPNRTNVKRDDGATDGASMTLAYFSAPGRHSTTTSRQWWLAGDSGRYAAFGGAGVATWQLNGATSQAHQLLKLTPSSTQTGANLEAYDTSGTLQTSILASGLLAVGSASATAPQIVSFTASPQGVIAAPVGSICFNRSGGASTTLYVREAATGATSGWVAK